MKQASVQILGLAPLPAGARASSLTSPGRTRTLALPGGTDQAQTTETADRIEKRQRSPVTSSLSSFFHLTATLWAKDYYYPHEETEARRSDGHTACNGVPGMGRRQPSLGEIRAGP